MLTLRRQWTIEECGHQGDDMIHRYHLTFLFKDGSMTLKPSVDVEVPPPWPLACARRVKFLSILAVRCEYVPGVQEKNRSTGDTIHHVDTFRKHV